MRKIVFISAATMLGLGLAVSLTGAPARAESAATQPTEKKAPHARITGEYAKLTLTDDQAAKIAQIQKEAKEKINAVTEDAAKQIDALLTDDQKKQIAEREAAEKEKTRTREAEYREKNKAIKEAAKSALATTQPSAEKK